MKPTQTSQHFSTASCFSTLLIFPIWNLRKQPETLTLRDYFQTNSGTSAWSVTCLLYDGVCWIDELGEMNVSQ